MAKKIVSVAERKEQLLAKIKAHTAELKKLETRQVHELGELAVKHGLHAVDLKTLGQHFEKLAKELIGKVA